MTALLLLSCKTDQVKEPSNVITLVSDHEGANLENWTAVASDEFDITIRGDTNAEAYRWYSFKVEGGAGETLTFRIVDAEGANAAAAWIFNRPVVSVDGGNQWDRITDTAYSNGIFSFIHTVQSDSDWIAYSPVYNFSRWLALVESIENHIMVASVEIMAQTLDGNPIHLIEIKDPVIPDTVKPGIWVTARQHPAETGGSWAMEGLIEWLLSDLPSAVELRRRTVVFLAGFLNPDGVLLGNYRMNRAGLNLNRVWGQSDPNTAPSVAVVEDAMRSYVASGGEIVLFADFHAHSTIRNNFFFYNDTRATSPSLFADVVQFMNVFNQINPDFSIEGSSSNEPPIGSGIAVHWVYNTFQTQAVTFESSYQDVLDGPYSGQYMTTERYRALGAGFGRAIAEHFFID